MPRMTLRPVAITPIAAPIRIARFAAFCGTSMIHCWIVPSGASRNHAGTHAWSVNGRARKSPSGTRPSITTRAATASRPASIVRMRNARKAAEAMKKASSENIVAFIGA